MRPGLQRSRVDLPPWPCPPFSRRDVGPWPGHRARRVPDPNIQDEPRFARISWVGDADRMQVGRKARSIDRARPGGYSRRLMGSIALPASNLVYQIVID